MAKFRILYVEDDQHLRETIGALMEEGDWEITLCASGEDALAACQGGAPFDLVVTDVSLPGISGTQLARSLIEQDPSRWIAICSGYDFGAAVGVLGRHVRSLNKPFEIEELEALIDEVKGHLAPPPAGA